MNSIATFMDQDHEELDLLWDDFLQKINSVETLEPAKLVYREFYDHIGKHIKLENTVLFPLFDKYTGLENGEGPTGNARRDHKNIAKLLNTVKKAIETNDLHLIRYSGKHLHRALIKHRERENAIQYPVLDGIIKNEELEKMINKIYK